MTEPAMVCGVCARVVNRYVESGTGRQAWVHGGREAWRGEDHPVVAVPADQVQYVGRCDFCHADHPAWSLPVAGFVMDEATLSDVTQVSESDWAACDTCIGLVRRNMWSALVGRAVVAVGPATPGQLANVQRHVSRLYRRLRKNIMGAPRPITR